MTNLNVLLTLTCCLLFFSCAQDLEEMEQVTSQIENFEPVLFSDLFCVDPHDESSADSRQFIYGPADWQKITGCEAKDLKYYIDPECEGSVYEQAIASAIAEYNGLASSLNYTQTTVYSEAHLFFNCQENGSCGSGSATTPLSTGDSELAPNKATTFPSGGKIGAEVRLPINWAYCACEDENNCSSQYNINNCMFKRLVMHEIGHALGIIHNDGAGNTDYQIIQWGPGVGYQQGSVFNSGGQLAQSCNWCHPELCSFNAADINILEKYYPPLPNYLPNKPDVTVYFDPCFDLIHLYDNANPQAEGWEYKWIVFGLSNTPHVNQKNPGYARVSYNAGEEFCLFLIVTGPCGDVVYYYEICYITPACSGNGKWILGVPIGEPECNTNSDCDAGYECQNYECVPIVIEPECQYDWQCPDGYVCDGNGNCIVDNTPFDCVHGQCPPGYFCIDGKCIEL